MIILDLEKIPKIEKQINFKIFLTDTKKTFINRIVYFLNKKFGLNTLPEYIYIPDFSFDREMLEVEELREISKKYKDINSFTLFYRDTNKKWNIEPTELFKLWVQNVEEIFGLDFMFQQIVLKYVNENVLKLKDSEFTELLRDIPNFAKEIQENVDKFMTNVSDEIEPEIAFEKIIGKSFTSFLEEKRKISIELSNNFSSLLDFFDISKLNEFVKYIYVRQNMNGKQVEYTKLSKSFSYLSKIKENIEEDEETSHLMIYLYNLDEIKNELTSKMYTPIKVIQLNERFQIELTVQTDQLDLYHIKERIQNTFTQTIYFTNEQNIYIGGLFYFPNLYFDKYILADLCISDDLFERFLKIDESLRAYRKKSSVYVYFTDPRYPDEFLTASISQRFMMKGDLRHVENRDDFKIGESYVRVKVSRGKSLQHVFRFQKILSKLFVEYNKKVDEIIDSYQEFIPNFGEIPKLEIKESKKTLKDIVPSQFISNYTRLCNRPPDIVFPEEKEDILKKYPDRQIITFPNTAEEGTQHEYICTDDVNKYPGVKRNNLANKDKFKYLPCCYPKDQRDRKNYKDYYENVQISKDEQVKNERIIITNKILNADNFGVLPEYLNNLLVSIQPDYDFYRKGVTRTKNSFIECITEAFDPEYKQFSRDDEKIPDFLEKIRMDLVETQSLSITRQEEYDKDVDEIERDILDMNQYFDPKKYYRLLEEKYNCNIYIFGESEMIIPKHLQNYLRYSKRYSNSVFIFEHRGSESDNARFPQCEIISGINPKIGEDTQFYTLPYRNNISISIEKIFVKYNQSYLYNQLSVRMRIPDNIKIISQSIDGYGKTRVLYLQYNNTKISIYTNPLPPLGVPEQQIEIIEIPLSLAKDVFKQLNIPIQLQTIINNKCIEISGFYKKILYTCPIRQNTPLNDVLSSEKRRIIPYESSSLNMFNKTYKQAKHLSQLFLHTFSDYFNDLNDNVRMADEISNEVFQQFVDTRIDTIDNYKYSKFNKIISQNGHAYNNNRLIVGGKVSKETLTRLMYFLRLNLERNIELVLNYHTKEYIYNYYDDITDFVKRDDELIIPGKNGLEQWLSEKNLEKKMYLNIDPNNKHPYFIKTSNKNLLNGEVYLCNNDTNLEQSMSRQYYWNNMKYNPNNISEMQSKTVDLEILKYQNMENITPLKDGKYKVLGYLKDGTAKYTTLLNLK